MPPTFELSDKSHVPCVGLSYRLRPTMSEIRNTIGVTETIWLSLCAAAYLAVICGCIIIQRIIKPRCDVKRKS
jgi:hypothetical protein